MPMYIQIVNDQNYWNSGIRIKKTETHAANMYDFVYYVRYMYDMYENSSRRFFMHRRDNVIKQDAESNLFWIKLIGAKSVFGTWKTSLQTTHEAKFMHFRTFLERFVSDCCTHISMRHRTNHSRRHLWCSSVIFDDIVVCQAELYFHAEIISFVPFCVITGNYVAILDLMCRAMLIDCILQKAKTVFCSLKKYNNNSLPKVIYHC